MFDQFNPSTFPALAELTELRSRSAKPVVLWIGAGASRWAGLSGWAEFAGTMHAAFKRHEPKFDVHAASLLIEAKSFPRFFELCKQVNRQRYFNLIVDGFQKGNADLDIYKRFITAIKQLRPSQILTTNIDELIEQSLSVPSILPQDLERVPALVLQNMSFVAKLHGSISSVDSLVFSEEDYRKLYSCDTFLNAMSRIIQSSHILFTGYGLADAEVVERLSEASRLNDVFGDGPHFACLASQPNVLPPNVKVIGLVSEPHKDHRSAIEVIEEMGFHPRAIISGSPVSKTPTQNLEALKSGHFLADFYPPGQWQTSQEGSIQKLDGSGKGFFCTGLGLTNSEVPDPNSTAMHDLLVGLICFDQVFASLDIFGKIYDLLGPTTLRDLIVSNALIFVRFASHDIVLFDSPQPNTAGRLTIGGHTTKDGKGISILERLRRQISPVHEKDRSMNEAMLTAFADLLATRCKDLPDPSGFDIPQMVRGFLTRPSIRSILGFGNGVPPSVVPGWLRYAVLRLAHVTRIGLACKDLNIASARLDFGNDSLAGSVFASTSVGESINAAASYVLAGRFDTDLGMIAETHKTLIGDILRFRDTQIGASLRTTILANLATSAGADVLLAINGCLRTFLPSHLLQAARDNIGLYVPPARSNLPSFWQNPEKSADALKRWRGRMRCELQQLCDTLKLRPYDLCPCGSGDKARFCCPSEAGIKLH